MSTFLVTYQIDDPAHEAALQSYLENFETVRLSATSCALDTNVSAVDLFHEIEDRLGPEDRVYVLSVGDQWIGYGYEAMNDWLHRHVGPGSDHCP